MSARSIDSLDSCLKQLDQLPRHLPRSQEGLVRALSTIFKDLLYAPALRADGNADAHGSIQHHAPSSQAARSDHKTTLQGESSYSNASGASHPSNALTDQKTSSYPSPHGQPKGPMEAVGARVLAAQLKKQRDALLRAHSQATDVSLRLQRRCERVKARLASAVEQGQAVQTRCLKAATRLGALQVEHGRQQHSAQTTAQRLRRAREDQLRLAAERRAELRAARVRARVREMAARKRRLTRARGGSVGDTDAAAGGQGGGHAPEDEEAEEVAGGLQVRWMDALFEWNKEKGEVERLDIEYAKLCKERDYLLTQVEILEQSVQSMVYIVNEFVAQVPAFPDIFYHGPCEAPFPKWVLISELPDDAVVDADGRVAYGVEDRRGSVDGASLDVLDFTTLMSEGGVGYSGGGGDGGGGGGGRGGEATDVGVGDDCIDAVNATPSRSTRRFNRYANRVSVEISKVMYDPGAREGGGGGRIDSLGQQQSMQALRAALMDGSSSTGVGGTDRTSLSSSTTATATSTPSATNEKGANSISSTATASSSAVGASTSSIGTSVTTTPGSTASRSSRLGLSRFRRRVVRDQDSAPAEEKQAPEAVYAVPVDPTTLRWLPCQGEEETVPLFLRFTGRVPEFHVNKRYCEMIIKHIWSLKCVEDQLRIKYQEPPITVVDFYQGYLERMFGKKWQRATFAYNFTAAQERYIADSDMELFFNIVMGRVSERYYLDQMTMIAHMKKSLALMDEVDGDKDGYIQVGVFFQGLDEFFPVKAKEDREYINKVVLEQMLSRGNHGVMQVDVRKLLEENAEGDQSEFMEGIREQHQRDIFQFPALIRERLYKEARVWRQFTDPELLAERDLKAYHERHASDEALEAKRRKVQLLNANDDTPDVAAPTSLRSPVSHSRSEAGSAQTHGSPSLSVDVSESVRISPTTTSPSGAVSVSSADGAVTEGRNGPATPRGSVPGSPTAKPSPLHSPRTGQHARSGSGSSTAGVGGGEGGVGSGGPAGVSDLTDPEGDTGLAGDRTSYRYQLPVGHVAQILADIDANKSEEDVHRYLAHGLGLEDQQSIEWRQTVYVEEFLARLSTLFLHRTHHYVPDLNMAELRRCVRRPMKQTM